MLVNVAYYRNTETLIFILYIQLYVNDRNHCDSPMHCVTILMSFVILAAIKLSLVI